MTPSTPLKSFGSFLFRLIRVAAVLALAAYGAFWLYQNRTLPEKTKKEHTPPSVRVLEAVPGSRVMTVEAFGTVHPRKEVKIAVEVPGRIQQVHPAFVEGGFIQKGGLLVRIDQRSYRLDRRTAAVRVTQARTDIRTLEQDIKNLKQDLALAADNVRLAKQEMNRVKALTKNQFASKNSLDRSEQSHLSARIQLQNIKNRLALTRPQMAQKKAALDMALADLDKANLALEKTEIRAAFDGFVLEKRAEEGEYVNPGQILGSLYEKGNLDVDVRIPLEQMRWIRDSFADGKTPGARVRTANLKGTDDIFWEASVARVKASIDETTRTLPMTLEIKDANGNGTGQAGRLFSLRPGTFVTCSIMGRNHDNIFEVPRHLLKSDDRLFLATGEKLEVREVKVLRKFENSVFIDAGLSPGDKIITSPLPGATDGMALTVKERGE